MCVCLFLNLRSIGLKLIWHILFRHSKWILSQYSIHMHWRKYDLKLLNALYILYIFLNVIYFVVLHQDLCLEQIYIDVTAVLLLTGSVILLWMRDSKHKQAKLSRPLHGPGSWSEEEWMSACLIKLHTHYHMAFFSWSDVQFFCFRICLRCCLFPQVSKAILHFSNDLVTLLQCTQKAIISPVWVDARQLCIVCALFHNGLQ